MKLRIKKVHRRPPDLDIDACKSEMAGEMVTNVTTPKFARGNIETKFALLRDTEGVEANHRYGLIWAFLIPYWPYDQHVAIEKLNGDPVGPFKDAIASPWWHGQ